MNVTEMSMAMCTVDRSYGKSIQRVKEISLETLSEKSDLSPLNSMDLFVWPHRGHTTTISSSILV